MITKNDHLKLLTTKVKNDLQKLTTKKLPLKNGQPKITINI